MNTPKKMCFVMLAAVLILSACAPVAPIVPPQPTAEPTPKENGMDESALLISSRPRNTAPPSGDVALRKLVNGNTAFAIDLYQRLAEEPGNLFYSPYSISLALAMTYAGARGETERQMAQTLRFSLPQAQLHPAFNMLDLNLRPLEQKPASEDEQPFQLNIANSLWGQAGFDFLPEFLDLLAENYGAGMYRVDYNDPENARRQINGWVEEQTREKIKDLIAQGMLNPMTRLVLVNAIYFKGAWVYPFDKESTRDAPFTLLDGSRVNVPMMYLAKDLLYLRGKNYTVVRLPYRDSSMGMTILVPDEGQFVDVEKALTPKLLGEIRSNFSLAAVRLAMPKFKMETSFNLSQTLAEMGMPAAFDRSLADFSGMTGRKDLFISNVVHKAYVDVNEEGTEAAAATAVIMELKAMPMNEVELTIDRPFLFFIEDQQSGTLLFAGRVVDPR
ncbi:MAG: serine/threonine protein kinase [Bellilinea sp.]|nr:MAG: serine/threonine protein kinase [Bellilinea sp.]